MTYSALTLLWAKKGLLEDEFAAGEGAIVMPHGPGFQFFNPTHGAMPADNELNRIQRPQILNSKDCTETTSFSIKLLTHIARNRPYL